MIDKTSMLMGWLVGRQIASQRGKKAGEPIAYLYNGVRFPKLPEWDKETYPYAFIVRMDVDWYYLFYSAYPLKEYSPTQVYVGSTHNQFYQYSTGDESWYRLWDNATLSKCAKEDLIWSNHNIQYSDGVGFYASDPVPVYE